MRKRKRQKKGIDTMNVHITVSLSRFLTLETIKEAIVSSYALIRLWGLRRWIEKKKTISGTIYKRRNAKIDDHSAYDIWFELYICFKSTSTDSMEVLPSCFFFSTLPLSWCFIWNVWCWFSRQVNKTAKNRILTNA